MRYSRASPHTSPPSSTSPPLPDSDWYSGKGQSVGTELPQLTRPPAIGGPIGLDRTGMGPLPCTDRPVPIPDPLGRGPVPCGPYPELAEGASTPTPEGTTLIDRAGMVRTCTDRPVTPTITQCGRAGTPGEARSIDAPDP